MNTMKKIASLILVALILCGAAMAESSRGDLTDRFADDSVIEIDGVEYRLRKRLTTLVGLVLNDKDGYSADSRAEMIVAVAVDDDERTFATISIDGGCQVEYNGETVALSDIYGLAGDKEKGVADTLAAVNELLPEGVTLESYLAFEAHGLTALDGEETSNEFDEAQFKARARAIKNGSAASEYSNMYSALGEYILTDMKSGAVMKVADKADRYTRTGLIDMPSLNEEGAEEAEDAPFTPDMDALWQILMPIWYEVNPW